MLAEYHTPRNSSAQERVLLRGQWCFTVLLRRQWSQGVYGAPGDGGVQGSVVHRRQLSPGDILLQELVYPGVCGVHEIMVLRRQWC